MDAFDGKVAVVTGGASGIGLGIVRALLAAGAQIAVLDLRTDHIAQAQADLVEYGGRLVFIQIDVSDRAAMAQAAHTVVGHFGQVDILVNNAGVGLQRSWAQVSYADWDFGLQVNLGGVINGIMTFEPLLRANASGGHIVNTASLAGLATVPAAMAIYGTTKTAIVALSEALAPEFSEAGIGMSVLCPGLVRSNILDIDANRPARFMGDVAARATTPEDRERDTSDTWMAPDDVARMVLEGIIAKRLYIITHPTHRDKFEARVEAVLEAWPSA
ncbi:SDR family NAD(P)-dependent oxidoreductase [Rhizorhapis suberifaciens]|uniref:NAD(P)-dependent dehydrogenase (Short-subunit alcohol dehydrogenase family) n=1 Tax=Rhizorhapis suberifaciens TaxID=13656 RepID=A0A840HT24_9SPHN|nr:SDR family NAD(P)-dependent oxidoreductase [Rhizorhapis suberifaciens]MBB4641155.1 NAD(P)-dependent dehydrogenase (short-subunit alcohol dehydrogenase family) [Rhizorhapis suberifaciens]